jgi:AcrR family transcriptional regulator
MAVTRRTGRRSTEEVKARIIEAATEQFSERGYAQTTMRSVAAAAEISLSVLYRHFPSKEELFSAALLAPFLSTFDEFAAAWSSQVENPWDDERLVGEFVRDLHHNLAHQRRTLVTLLAAGDSSDTELLEDVRQRLAAGLTQLRGMAEHEARVRGWFKPEVVPYTNALMIAMVTGLVLLRPWFPEPMRGDDETLIDVASALAVHGFRLAPPDQRPADLGAARRR